jgi:tetratricopeptide (TPR) repeat protein
VTLALLLLASACASAEKRLEQGQELESAGRFEAAVGRYVEALEKDASIPGGRERLQTVGDSAVARRLSNVRALRGRGDYAGAADQYRGADGLVARARTVGVHLSLPPDYREARRRTFDDAFDGLMARGRQSAERGRWEPAVEDFQAARSRFEPSMDQRAASLEAEAEALLGWSDEALEVGRLQAAFEVASRIEHLEHAPSYCLEEAQAIMHSALSQGEVEVMVLPVVTAGRTQARNPLLIPLEIEVNDHLDRSAWRSPPPFVRLADAVRVREIVRRAAVLGGGLQAPALGLLLELVDSDYGVWLELIDTQVMEYDVDQRTRTARTRDGRPTSFVVESGERRLRAEARVLVVDRSGNAVTDMVVVGTGTGSFQRGVYAGNPAELNLDRREIDWFDPMVIEAQEAAIRQALSASLANQLAGAVFDPVLARIP